MLGNVSAVQTANFEGIGGVLSLAPPDFLGAIGNFAGGDVIDCRTPEPQPQASVQICWLSPSAPAAPSRSQPHQHLPVADGHSRRSW
jgi:hypothetical protein